MTPTREKWLSWNSPCGNDLMARGGAPVAPFVAANNLFDRRYVSSVVINATRGRYYEPAPGRNVYHVL